MTSAEFNRAVLIARSRVSLESVDDTHLHGCALPEFQKTPTSLEAVAKLLRWQCQYLNVGWDEEEIARMWRIARYKFIVAGQGSDDTASLPAKILAQALDL